MKKIVILLFIFLLQFTNICFSQSGWVWQNPLPVGSRLRDCFFVNNNTGYACGDNGSIIKTFNAGLNWIQLNSSCNRFLTSVFFTNESTGYITTGDNMFPTNSILLKTTNAGLSWFELDTFYNTHLSSANFYNDNTGYVVGGKYWWGGRIYKTTNAGLDWTLYPDLSTNFMNSIFFTSLDTCYVAGDDGKILKTTNQGLNWIFLNTGTNNYTTYNSICFTNSYTGFAAGNGGRIYKTTDMGNDWTLLNTGTFGGFSEMSFQNESTGFACGWGIIFRTTNAGDSWDSLTTLCTENLITIKCIDLNSIICCGHNGTVLKSVNNGTNWSSISNKITSASLNSSYIFDSARYFIVGDSSKLLKTSDGGINWSSVYFGTNDSFKSIYFTSQNTGYIAGGYSVYSPPFYTAYYAKIYETTSGGSNWFLIYGLNQEPNMMYDVKFVSPLTGFSIGGSASPPGTSGVILKTTNAGTNWVQKNYGGNECLYSICMRDSLVGYVSGSNGKIYKTINGAESWTVLNTGITFTIYSLDFPTYNVGYAGSINQILKTTNAGLNWISYNFNISYDITINRIAFVNEYTGFAVGVSFPDYGRAGDIVKTTDGGLNWIHISTFPSYPTYQYRGLNSISIINNVGLIVGEIGTILKSANGTIPNGIHSLIDGTYSIFSLSQNYPNPFNPVTKIKFAIPPSKGVRGMMTSLKVYDILGREVSTLVNEQLKPGSYEVEWNGTNHASGIYFYRLEAGEFVEAKKMVLIK